MSIHHPLPCRLAVLTLAAAVLAMPVAAAELPPGLAGAALLGGAVQPDGTILAAVHLQLEPGWKTYWRSPGDAGIAPGFDWSGSQNLSDASPLWPRPEVIDTDGERTLGYHDELVLPLRVTPAIPGEPVGLHAVIDFGLCQNVCVPAHVELQGTAPADPPDPRIETALALVPTVAVARPACTVTDIPDGVRVTARLPVPAPTGAAAAMELDAPEIWVSAATMEGDTATAEFVGPSGKPFPLDTDGLHLTLIAPDKAVEYRGCAG